MSLLGRSRASTSPCTCSTARRRPRTTAGEARRGSRCGGMAMNSKLRKPSAAKASTAVAASMSHTQPKVWAPKVVCAMSVLDLLPASHQDARCRGVNTPGPLEGREVGHGVPERNFGVNGAPSTNGLEDRLERKLACAGQQPALARLEHQLVGRSIAELNAADQLWLKPSEAR